MALPRINEEKPIYELTLPTSKRTYKYRPFLVKEQRNILMASESGSAREGILAMLQCINSCAPDVDINELSTAEVDYIFLQIRAKSVGEKTELNLNCKECEAQNKYTVDFNEVKILGSNDNNVIHITDDIKLKMKYNSYSETAKNIDELQHEESTAKLIFKALKLNLHSLEVNDELILFSDESDDEVDGFLNSLNTEQLEKCISFMDNLPKLNYEANFVCKNCGAENKNTFERFQDFF
mgnify:CR=1 FL=1